MSIFTLKCLIPGHDLRAYEMHIPEIGAHIKIFHVNRSNKSRITLLQLLHRMTRGVAISFCVFIITRKH